MSYIILIIVACLFLKVCGKILKKILPPSAVGFWMFILILLLIPDCSWIGWSIVGIRYILMPILKYQQKVNATSPKRKDQGGGINWNY